MTTRQDIQDALFDADGSARDITFTPVSAEGVASLFRVLQRDFQLQGAFDSEGDDVAPAVKVASIDDLFPREKGSVHSIWSSSGHVISHLQVFVSWPERDDQYFVELTFFPNDLIRERFSLGSFAQIIEDLAETLQAENYFVRYENASWKEYDGEAPDVIYTRRTKPTQNKRMESNG